MVDLRKLFTRDPPGGEQGRDTEVNPSLRSGENLEIEYETLLTNQLRRWGISPTTVTVQVKQLGRAGDGHMVYVGMLRLGRWERFSALRVLIGLPLLEAKLRRMVRTLWLGEVSHFGGLWLHASEQLSNTPAMTELREVMLELTPFGSRPTRSGEEKDSLLQAAPGTSSGMPLNRPRDSGAAPLSSGGLSVDSGPRSRP